MSIGVENNARICCKHCGWKKLTLSYRQVGRPAEGPAAVGQAEAPPTVTLIMRCLKCDRFTPVAG